MDLNDELTGLGDGMLLTADLLMDRLGIYDLMATKEVYLSMAALAS